MWCDTDKVVVVVLNWNGCEMLRSLLPSVVRCSETESTEVCVTDNDSAGASVRILRQEFLSVHLITLDGNRSLAEGYNPTLQQVSAEYMVLLNSDVETTGRWLTPLVDYMDAHPEVAVCQLRIRSRRHRGRFEYTGAAGGSIDRYGYPFCRGRIMRVVGEDNGQYDTVVPVFWATGVVLPIRLKGYQDAGRLDRRFFAHMEEIGLCWRLRAYERVLACVPQSTVYHVGGATLEKENPHKTFLNFRNNLVMLYRSPSGKELGHVMHVRAVLDCMTALSFLLKSQLANMWTVLRTHRAFYSLRPLFAAGREESLRKTSLPVIPEWAGSSILARFYLHGRKFFSRL